MKTQLCRAARSCKISYCLHEAVSQTGRGLLEEMMRRSGSRLKCSALKVQSLESAPKAKQKKNKKQLFISKLIFGSHANDEIVVSIPYCSRHLKNHVILDLKKKTAVCTNGGKCKRGCRTPSINTIR